METQELINIMNEKIDKVYKDMTEVVNHLSNRIGELNSQIEDLKRK